MNDAELYVFLVFFVALLVVGVLALVAVGWIARGWADAPMWRRQEREVATRDEIIAAAEQAGYIHADPRGRHTR
ncbi:hypothetical protein [Nocardiopsis gilva]|uniref:hypothetical protein n=1 Tax=Nocardiopsis gilva TaxID=280236 RepID=UPI000349820F|nr:hypothetical protein [Nocardiopsis gilva]